MTIRYLLTVRCLVAAVLSGAWIVAAGAQPLRVQNFEGGLGLLRNCVSLGADKGYSAGINPLPLLLPSAELRFNFPNTPWDIGVAYSYIEAPYDDIDFASNETMLFGLCSHYNLRQGRKVNPFFGLAAGVAVWDCEFHKSNCGFAVEPRVGVEFVYHIRLSLACQISRRCYNALGLTVGFVIGGRPKKTPK